MRHPQPCQEATGVLKQIVGSLERRVEFIAAVGRPFDLARERGRTISDHAKQIYKAGIKVIVNFTLRAWLADQDSSAAAERFDVALVVGEVRESTGPISILPRGNEPGVRSLLSLLSIAFSRLGEFESGNGSVQTKPHEAKFPTIPQAGLKTPPWRNSAARKKRLASRA